LNACTKSCRAQGVARPGEVRNVPKRRRYRLSINGIVI
jgi:hypothetical protein